MSKMEGKKAPSWRLSSTVVSDGRIKEKLYEISFSNKNKTEAASLFPKKKEIKPYTLVDLSNNPIESMDGFPLITTLETLIIDNTKIPSFNKFVEQTSLETFSCVGTPLALLPHLRIMSAIVFGENLRVVNGRKLTIKEIEYANTYRKEIQIYLTDGWVIVTLNPLKITNIFTKERRTIYIDKSKPSGKTDYNPVEPANEYKNVNYIENFEFDDAVSFLSVKLKERKYKKKKTNKKERVCKKVADQDDDVFEDAQIHALKQRMSLTPNQLEGYSDDDDSEGTHISVKKRKPKQISESDELTSSESKDDQQPLKQKPPTSGKSDNNQKPNQSATKTKKEAEKKKPVSSGNSGDQAKAPQQKKKPIFSDSEEEEEIPQRKPKKAVFTESSEEDEAPKKAPSRKSSGKGKPQKKPPVIDSEEEEEIPQKKRTKFTESSEEEEAPQKQKPKKAVFTESSEEEEEVPQKKKRPVFTDSSEEEEELPQRNTKNVFTESSEEEKEAPQKREAKRAVFTESSEEEEEEIPQRRRPRKIEFSESDD